METVQRTEQAVGAPSGLARLAVAAWAVLLARRRPVPTVTLG